MILFNGSTGCLKYLSLLGEKKLAPYWLRLQHFEKQFAVTYQKSQICNLSLNLPFAIKTYCRQDVLPSAAISNAERNGTTLWNLISNKNCLLQFYAYLPNVAKNRYGEAVWVCWTVTHRRTTWHGSDGVRWWETTLRSMPSFCKLRERASCSCTSCFWSSFL